MPVFQLDAPWIAPKMRLNSAPFVHGLWARLKLANVRNLISPEKPLGLMRDCINFSLDYQGLVRFVPDIVVLMPVAPMAQTSFLIQMAAARNGADLWRICLNSSISLWVKPRKKAAPNQERLLKIQIGPKTGSGIRPRGAPGTSCPHSSGSSFAFAGSGRCHRDLPAGTAF